MNFNLNGYLSPAQLAVIGFLDKTGFWWTARDVSLKTGVGLSTTIAIIRRLEHLGRIKKRLHRGGFDDGLLEYRMAFTANSSFQKNKLDRHYIYNVEPFAVKLRKFLPADRAREAEAY